MPFEFTLAIFDAPHEAGADLDAVGYYAVDSLSIEKGFQASACELTPGVNPYEVGRGFAVKLDKGDFIGHEALVAVKASPRTKQLVSLSGSRPKRQMVWGGEAIMTGFKPVDETTSDAFGASLDGIAAIGSAESQK